jgi:hypothetical protein
LAGSNFMTERQKSALFHTGILPAGETINLTISGDKFFLDVATGPLLITPDTGNQVKYFPGMGLRFDREKRSFALLQVKNPNAYAVYFQLFAGFDDLDDRRTFYPSIQFKQIVNATHDWSVDGADLATNVPDLSGGTLTYDGETYYAVNRQLLYVFNQNSANGAFVENPTGRRLAFVLPYGSLQIPLTGDLVIDNPSACELFISELYNCLPTP